MDDKSSKYIKEKIENLFPDEIEIQYNVSNISDAKDKRLMDG